MKLKIFTPLTILFLSFGFQVKAQLNVELLGHLDYGGDQLSNLTGWASGTGKEYAIVGTYNGTSIVDVTDPASPNEVQFVDGNNSIWREVRTWSNYAYVVTENGGGLLCIDLSGLPFTIDFNYTDCGVGLETGHTVFAEVDVPSGAVDDSVVVPAEQDTSPGVGVAAVDPVVDVVGDAVLWCCVTSGEYASSVSRGEGFALLGGVEALCSTDIDRVAETVDHDWGDPGIAQ